MAQGTRPGALTCDHTGALVGLTFTEAGIVPGVSSQGDEVTTASSVMYLTPSLTLSRLS